MEGYINSIQTLGTVDGPGVRFVVFLQGCNLKCGCCHNPETQEFGIGNLVTAKEIVDKCARYKEYFKNGGGITVSGGEPVCQAEFVKEIFKLSKEKGIHTCLDTSGSILNENVKEMLKFCDLVLLDIKYTNNEYYEKYAGCEMAKPLAFLDYLCEQKIPTIIRQVMIPSLNDTKENILELKKIISKYPNIIKTELLPFKKLCKVKYENLNRDFPFDIYPAAEKADVDKLGEEIEKN